MASLESLSVPVLMAIYIGIALLGVAVFALILNRTWHSHLAMLDGLTAFFRGIPIRWRMARDPVFRNRILAAGSYEAALEDMLMAKCMYLLATESAPKEERKDARERRIAAAREEVLITRKAAADAIIRLDDDAVQYVAERLHERWIKRTSPLEDVVAFLKDEREMIVARPYLMDTHFLRFAQRFGVGYSLAEGPVTKQQPFA
jgi:hypothetical protein